MFRGQYEHTMDSKGRVSLPARYREILSEQDATGENANRVILTRTFQKCLVLYPMDQWLNFEEKVRALPQFDPNVQRLKRVYIAGATEVQLDANGRLLIPQPLRDFGGFSREVIWVGQLDTVELWSQEKWQGALDEAMEDPAELAQSMAMLGL